MLIELCAKQLTSMQWLRRVPKTIRDLAGVHAPHTKKWMGASVACAGTYCLASSLATSEASAVKKLETYVVEIVLVDMLSICTNCHCQVSVFYGRQLVVIKQPNPCKACNDDYTFYVVS